MKSKEPEQMGTRAGTQKFSFRFPETLPKPNDGIFKINVCNLKVKISGENLLKEKKDFVFIWTTD